QVAAGAPGSAVARSTIGSINRSAYRVASPQPARDRLRVSAPHAGRGRPVAFAPHAAPEPPSALAPHLVPLTGDWALWRTVCLRGAGFGVHLLEALGDAGLARAAHAVV